MDFINPLKEMMLLAGALSVTGFIVAGVKAGTELGAQGFIFGVISTILLSILMTTWFIEPAISKKGCG